MKLPVYYGSYDLLAHLASGAVTYLGIGVQEGGCVASVVKANPYIHLTLCDTWGFEDGGTGRGNHDHIDVLLGRMNHQGSVRYLDGPSQERLLEPALGPCAREYDLTYVDGSHEEEKAYEDMRLVWPRTSRFMVVHDIRMAQVWAALTRFLDTIERESTVSAFMGGSGTAVVKRIV